MRSCHDGDDDFDDDNDNDSDDLVMTDAMALISFSCILQRKRCDGVVDCDGLGGGFDHDDDGDLLLLEDVVAASSPSPS